MQTKPAEGPQKLLRMWRVARREDVLWPGGVQEQRGRRVGGVMYVLEEVTQVSEELEKEEEEA